MLREAVGWLRDELRDVADIEIERAFYEALDLIASSTATVQTQKSLMLEDSYATWLGVTRQASVALDLSSLKDTLIKGLPAAGVRTAFLSCALGADAATLTPVVGLVDGQPVTSPEASFPVSKLVPPSSLALVPRRTFLVFPAAVESQLLGVAAFDYADGGKNYAVFRNEITAVLKSIRLHQELVQKTTLHERSVQERLATTKRMEALSVLAGGVAHDLNNALGPLVALPDLILRDLKNLSADASMVAKLTADVEIIKTASLRAAQTIKDLLTLGRQGRTVREPLDLNRVVRSCVAESSLRLVEERSRQVRVVVDYFGDTLTVRGSEAQLARAIGNLLRNAGDAIRGNGTIRVTTRLEQLHATANRYETIPAGDFAVVAVADDGCGIEAVDVGRVFEPFFSKKRTGDSSGSGLGLAIVHGVVKEHDGWIDLTSTPGKGTTFSLYFPLAQPAQKEAPPVASSRRTPAKILIVDDEAVQRRTCRRVLAELGYQVDTMESGLRAYHVFRRAAATGTSPYDLLVLDMVLGESLDGLQIFDLIQRLFPEQKAIVASGHAPSGQASMAVDKGLVWLAKPYTVDALTQAVERILASKP